MASPALKAAPPQDLRRLAFGSFSGVRVTGEESPPQQTLTHYAEGPIRSPKIARLKMVANVKVAPESSPRVKLAAYESFISRPDTTEASVPDDIIYTGPETSTYGVTTHTGVNAKKENQDAFFYVESFGGDDSATLFGVFDGHGKDGAEASRFAKDSIHRNLSFLFKKRQKREDEIYEAFLLAQKEMECSGKFRLSGTTASVCLIVGMDMFIANVGDSKGILGRECPPCIEKYGKNAAHIGAFEMTLDHKLNKPKERKRITDCGGLVKRHPKISHDCERIWKEGETYPGLVVTRSLGDTAGHELGVLPDPDIRRKHIDEHDKIIILASDGVWDVISPQESLELVSKCNDPGSATVLLIEACLKSWKEKYTSGDNITAIVVYLGTLKKYDQTHSCQKEPEPQWEELSKDIVRSNSSKACIIL